MIDEPRLVHLEIDPDLIKYRNQSELIEFLGAYRAVTAETIGKSREGQPMVGISFGTGPISISLIGGSHADEPIGPMTAQLLFPVLQSQFPELLELYTFHVIPQMNPDGADRNRKWFSNPIQLDVFLNNVIREKPGDDIEFGFGEDGDERPECKAMMSFLRKGGPYGAHFSLHGLGFAEGAWCLVCKEWAEKGKPYMDAFSSLCNAIGFPQHDIDRKGDKGFVRLGKGYTTTPHSEPMKEHFLALNDPETAAKFKPSSMQWVQSLGGDPLCIVSELPLFHIGVPSPSLEDLTTTHFKSDLTLLRSKNSTIDTEMLNPLVDTYKLIPTPIDLQLKLQLSMIILGITNT
jgi:hypothetical protein